MICKHFLLIFSLVVALMLLCVPAALAQTKVVVIPLTEDAAGPPAPVPKTGQEDCYYDDDTSGSCTCGTVNCPSGQDGDLEKGEAWPDSRFVDHGNGTVTDKLTGLVWLKDGNCSFHPTNPTLPNDRSWTSALAACTQLASGTGRCDLTDGSSAGDWRLPNRKELLSLIDLGQYDPALSAGCPLTLSTAPNYYWSSTTFFHDSDGSAWMVSFSSGQVYYDVKRATQHVRCVR